ncbi:unnamed protein product [Rotaria sordida]|uniref:BED-type domain-containing protein n=1 Tax=Rotaria sordida TaxID=392033 RepID=A0A815NZ18_9BILA|nr:unnamed protein product [Rotaria sordida]CAF1442574.1 unnamed protein product [Rotaria sordida]CAF3813516.1 unnamed protein product [Rotaria sordida]CAF3968871.1 unnamed protein product [Rotaria sordida]
MSASSSRRSPSRASSVSSGSSTPVFRRQKVRQNSNITARNTSSNSSTSSARPLRRLQSNSKTVKWANFNDNNNSNDLNVRNETINDQQQQTLQVNEISMSSDESNNDMTPSTIINNLSLSSSNNNNNNNNDITAASASPTVSDADENVKQLTTTDKITMVDSKLQQNMMKLTELLTFFDECDGGTAYICKLCQAKLKKQNRSTANIRRHIGNKHAQPMFMFESQKEQAPHKISPISIELQEKLDEKQVKCIIVDSRPFGDFSRKGMREFLATAVPGYKPLHRTTVRKRLRTLYIEHRRTLRKVLQNVTDLALTTDIWKDNRNRFYISLTGHFYDKQLKLISLTLGFRLLQGRHIANRLAKYIKNEIMSLNIEEKVRCIVTDNAPNVVSAIHKLGIGIHHSCMAHNLNLVIKSTLFPSKKKKKSSSSKSTLNFDDQSSINESSAEDDASVDDYSSSDEETHSSNHRGYEDTSFINQESSVSEDDASTSSDDEELISNISTTTSIDPTLLSIRSLIKRVRELVGLVNKSGPLSEYIRQQAKEKKLPGEVCNQEKTSLV